jgi:hypothetical protein
MLCWERRVEVRSFSARNVAKSGSDRQGAGSSAGERGGVWLVYSTVDLREQDLNSDLQITKKRCYPYNNERPPTLGNLGQNARRNIAKTKKYIHLGKFHQKHQKFLEHCGKNLFNPKQNGP